MYYFILDDVKSTDKKIQVSKRPNFPSVQKDYDEIDLKGKNGKYYVDLGTYQDITFEISCNYIEDINEWAKKWRNVKKWLLKSHEQLSFSDDENYFYKVKKISISDNERKIKQSGEFTISVTCEAYSYLKVGQQRYDVSQVLQNDYEVSNPIYEISGIGACTLNVNGHQVDIVVNENFNIDVEKQIAYDNNKNSLNDEILVDYEDLRLIEGLNAISISSGFTLKVIPNWREF